MLNEKWEADAEGIHAHLKIMADIGQGSLPGSEYKNLADFVEGNGRAMQPSEFTGDRGRMGECYMNAFWLAQYEGHVYCEGYAFTERLCLPLMHAWCLDKRTDKVLDPTWEDGVGYWGVPIQTSYATSVVSKAKTYGVIDKWELEWPILKDPRRQWAVDPF